MTTTAYKLSAILSFTILPHATASLAVFDFQSAWTGAKEPDFSTFAANSASTDTDPNSTISQLSNNGFNDGGYNSFSLKDAVANTSIYSTSLTAL